MSKRVSDPVYGTVELSDLEVAVVDTGAFQRLRRVKHLGMASLVFPGADFSRFSHSIGVCHVIGRMFDALQTNGSSVEVERRPLYRLAGLLHDLGHYPFSHALERPIKDHYKTTSGIVTASGVSKATLGQAPNLTDDQNNPDVPPFFEHESLGVELLRNDAELIGVLKHAGVDPEEVARLFTRASPDDPFANLISSDVDADRLDYLQRTALHSGLPYGRVDLDYLLSQLVLASGNRLCVRRKALRTAEHVLLSRYFDNQQVAFHKSVAAFELVLEDVVLTMLRAGALRCSGTEIREMVKTGSWHTFDDGSLLSDIREFTSANADPLLNIKADVILRRKPPKLVAEISEFNVRDWKGFNDKLKILKSVREEAGQALGIPDEYWMQWLPKSRTITKAPGSVALASMLGKTDWSIEEDELRQAIYVYEQNRDPVPIFQVPDSLVSQLADRALYSTRIYLLPIPGKPIDIDDVRKRFHEGLS